MEDVSSSLARLPSSGKLGCPGEGDYASPPAVGAAWCVIVSQVENP